MEKPKENTDLISTTLGLIIIFIVMLVVNKLLEPLKSKQEYELSGEKLSGLFQSVKNTILVAFGTPTIPVESSYNLYLNLLFPFILVCLACAIAVFVIFHLVKSFIYDEDIIFNKVLTIIFILILISVLCFLLTVAWHLLFLKLKAIFTLALVIAIIFGAVFHKKNKRSDES